MKKKIEHLPDQLRELINLASRIAAVCRMPAYLVGGFARDLLLGVENLDLDIVVVGDGIAFAEKLAAALNARLIRHKAFGTATVIPAGHLKIDVSSARKESYPAAAKLPQVRPGSLKDDLFRRDFTINAMAIDISEGNFGQLKDYFGGRRDLSLKKIRVMHEASFIDDPTRILRAARFEKRYAFKIEPRTLKLLKEAAALKMLEKVEPHRIRDELILDLKEKNPLALLKRINALTGFGFISRGLVFSKKSELFLRGVEKQILWFRKNYPHRRKLDAWLMYLAAVLEPLSAGLTEDVCQRYAFRRGESSRLICFKKIGTAFIRKLSGTSVHPSRVFCLLEPLPYEVILMLRAKFANPNMQRHIADFFSVYNGMRISLHGEDLQKLGLRPGPQYQQIFERVLRAKLDGKASSRQDELALAKKIAAAYIKRAAVHH